MSEENVGYQTYGVGPKVTEHKASKRIKAAHRKAKKASKISLKTFARTQNDEDSKTWFTGKENAKLSHKSKSAGMVKIPKAPKADKKKKG